MIPSHITLHGLATTSLLVSLLIVVFLPLRPLLRRVIGSQWVCVLWLALLVRLLMPWPLESRWSVFSHWRNQAPAAVAAPLKIKVSFPKDDGVKEKETGTPIASPTAIAHPAMSSHWDIGNVADIAWLAGVALSLGVLAWRWMQTRRYAAKTRPATDERLRNIFDSIPQELRRDTELRMTDALHVPTLAGYFRPQIWMPLAWPAQFTDEELRNVLLHELGHARRRDLLVQWLFAIAQCLHWFNPLVWIAARAARLDREMACDAWVLARNDADHSGYGAALMKSIQLLRAPLHGTPATVAMASNRRNLSARISGIGAFQPMPAWRGATAAAIMIAALVAATTSRIQGEDATPQPSAPPGTDANNSRQNIHVQSQFVMITEEAWKKLCAENPEFKDFAGKLPELDSEKEPVADLVKGLNDTNLKKGAWQVSREIKLLAPLTAEERQKMIATLNGTKGASILGTPSAITRVGQNAEIEMVGEEFRYITAIKPSTKDPGDIEPAEFASQNMGITLEAASGINKRGSIDVKFTATMEGCLGYLLENNGPRKFSKQATKGTYLKPLFSVSTGSASVSIAPTGSVLLGGVTLDNQSTESDTPTDDPLRKWVGQEEIDKAGEPNPETVRHVLLVFATAETYTPPAPAPAAKGEQIEMETKFVEITEDSWKKLRSESPSFEDFKSNFPELSHEKPDYSKVTDLFTQPEKGAWEVPGAISLLSVLSGDDMTKMLKSLDSVEGVNMLAAPSVTTMDNQRALVDVVTEFRYPSEFEEDKDRKPAKAKNEAGDIVYAILPRFTPTAFVTKNVGVSLDATPKLNKDGTIDLILAPELSDFLGFATDESGVKTLTWNARNQGSIINRPVFSNLSGTTNVTVEAGKTLLLGGVMLGCNKSFNLKELIDDATGTKPDIYTGHPDTVPETVRHVALVFVTAKIADPDQPARVSHIPPPEPARDSKIPHGVPVDGKPGFATSPYAPDSGPVDLRGYPKDTEVKDPYTGKTFLVP